MFGKGKGERKKKQNGTQAYAACCKNKVITSSLWRMKFGVAGSRSKHLENVSRRNEPKPGPLHFVSLILGGGGGFPVIPVIFSRP